MPEIKYQYKLSAVNDTKKAIDEAKRGFQSLEKSTSGVSLAGAARPKGAASFAPPKALPPAIYDRDFAEQQKLRQGTTAALVGGGGKEQQKSLSKIASLLNDIKKNTDMNAMGRGGGQPPGVGAGRGGANLPAIPGGKGAGGLGSIMKILGPIGAAIGAIGFIGSLLGRMGGGFKEAAKGQLPVMRQLGFMGGGLRRGNLFTGNAERGITSQERMATAQGYATQTMGKTLRTPEEQFKYTLRTLGVRNLSDDMISAYGADPSTVGSLQGRIERFGRKGTKGYNVLPRLVGGAEETGMGGARMNEFLNTLGQTIDSSISQGFTAIPEQMGKSLLMLQSVKDQQTKTLAPSVISSAQSRIGQAGKMRGGAAGGFAFQAASKLLSKGGKTPTITEVQEQLALGATPENLKSQLELAEKTFGKLGESDMTRWILDQQDFFGNVKSPTKQVALGTAMKNWDKNSGTDYPKVQEATADIKERATQTETFAKAMKAAEIHKEVQSINRLAGDANGLLTKIASAQRDMVILWGGKATFAPPEKDKVEP